MPCLRLHQVEPARRASFPGASGQPQQSHTGTQAQDDFVAVDSKPTSPRLANAGSQSPSHKANTTAAGSVQHGFDSSQAPAQSQPGLQSATDNSQNVSSHPQPDASDPFQQSLDALQAEHQHTAEQDASSGGPQTASDTHVQTDQQPMPSTSRQQLEAHVKQSRQALDASSPGKAESQTPSAASSGAAAVTDGPEAGRICCFVFF